MKYPNSRFHYVTKNKKEIPTNIEASMLYKNKIKTVCTNFKVSILNQIYKK